MIDTTFEAQRPLDVFAIEAEARRLRAEAAAAMIRAAARRVAAWFGHQPVPADVAHGA